MSGNGLCPLRGSAAGRGTGGGPRRICKVHLLSSLAKSNSIFIHLLIGQKFTERGPYGRHRARHAKTEMTQT